MKKVIIAFVVVLLLVGVAVGFWVNRNSEKTLSNVETAKLATESYLDILVNIGEYPDDRAKDDLLLEAAMRIARELDLVQTETEPIYIEYVPRTVIHQIIEELTGKKQETPIVEEGFYYLYDEEKDYYYIVPVGTEWVHYGTLKSATEKGDIYEVHCTIEDSSEFGVSKVIYDDVKMVLERNTKNQYVKYKLVRIEMSDYLDVYNPVATMNFGVTEQNREMICYSFTPENYEKTVFLNFAIHGFEDNYDKDGQVLVDMANQLIQYYTEHPEAYRNTRLLIVPCANPDGLEAGTTNNGFGRCNANGVDLNRDFDAEHKVFTNARNKTLEPFSAVESRALRDLFLDYDVDVLLDFHGWLDMTIGDGSLAEIFEEEMDLKHKTEFNANCNGYFSYWANLKGAEALLVEFKDENISFDKLISALDKII